MDICNLVDPNACDNRDLMEQADPSVLLNACQQVTDAIVASGDSVTFHLARPWSPFLTTLALSWGYIMDREWTITNGGWDGDCSTWQNYYAPTSADDPFTAIVNGTGPFMLDHWTRGTEIVLVRNPDYWRQTPMWTDGPMGPAAIERVEITIVADRDTRVNMLMNGEADLTQVPASYRTTLDPLVLMDYAQPDGLTPTLVNPSGVLRSYSGGLSTTAQDAFFNYDIATGGPRNYVGSGILDGNGIPVDFFNEIHVREGFSYAFDWDQYITQAFGGDAIQRRGPIIKGILGYSDSQPTYSHNPTLAMQEFSQAWGGQVSSLGFTLTIAYNEGNETRRIFCETLEAGIEALDPKFHVNVVALPWPDYSEDMRERRLPIFVAGWIQDIPHPHNWLVPYLLGTYAYRQSLPADQQDAYRAEIYACLALTGSAAQTCYEDIQNDTYLNATDIFLAQGTWKDYVRAEVRGYYINVGMFGAYFYALSKGPAPTIRNVTASADQTIPFASQHGSTGSLFLPAGTVNQTVDIAVIPALALYYGNPTGYHLSNFSFEAQAFAGDGTFLPDLTLNNPVIVTIDYNAQTSGYLIEDSLTLFRWNGTAWVDAACGPYTRDAANNRLQVPVCHLSRFGLGGDSYDVFLPLISRNAP
jgi:peptide/nickel transport system substrate-binding protein